MNIREVVPRGGDKLQLPTHCRGLAGMKTLHPIARLTL